MKARKIFVVIAYDITSSKNRNRIAKLIIKHGGRVNLSVFECMLTDSQFEKLRGRIAKLVNAKTDQVAYYVLCLDCYTKIIYEPEKKRKEISSSDVV